MATKTNMAETEVDTLVEEEDSSTDTVEASASAEETPRSIPPEVEEYLGDSLCPRCGVLVEYRCRLCGSTKSVNQASGNVIWMKNGKVVRAFRDERQAWVQMAQQYGIPVSEWPVAFQPKR